MDKIKVPSLNVRGIRDKLKRMTVLNYIKKFKADVVLLSEAHMLDGDYKH